MEIGLCRLWLPLLVTPLVHDDGWKEMASSRWTLSWVGWARGWGWGSVLIDHPGPGLLNRPSALRGGRTNPHNLWPLKSKITKIILHLCPFFFFNPYYAQFQAQRGICAPWIVNLILRTKLEWPSLIHPPFLSLLDYMSSHQVAQ